MMNKLSVVTLLLQCFLDHYRLGIHLLVATILREKVCVT